MMKTDLEHDMAYSIAGKELKADGNPDGKPSADARAHEAAIASSPGNAKRSRIPGWGTDLARNRPRNMQPEEPHPIAAPEPLTDQVPTVEVLHSTERPGLTPLFGTSVPPSALSGVLRRMAYKQSENDIRRWLTLMLSDCVDVVEGIGADLREGKIPNIFQEMGLRAEWKYNRAGLARKALFAAAVVGVACFLGRRR